MGRKFEFLKNFNDTYMALDTAGRTELSRRHMAEDYVCIEPPELPQGGIFRGWDAGPKISAIYRDLWDLELIEMTAIDDDDSDTLVIRTVYRWTSRETGRVLEEPVVELVRFNEDFRIQSFEVFHFDPAGLVATLPGRG